MWPVTYTTILDKMHGCAILVLYLNENVLSTVSKEMMRACLKIWPLPYYR